MTSARRPRGQGGLHQRADGLWIGTVDLGSGGDGRRRRRTVSAKTRPLAARKLAALRAQVDAGALPGPSIKVEDWLERWMTDIAGPRLRPRTRDDYRSVVDRHLVPNLGNYRMSALAPQHVRDLHKTLAAAGLSPQMITKVHRYLGTAMADAVREGVVTRNVTSLVPTPRKTRQPRTALSIQQATHLLRVADEQGDPLVTRWAAALLLGARQGELLGLTWDRVDLDAGTVDLAWQLQSLSQVHGCGGTCGRTRAGWCPQKRFEVPLGFEIEPIVGTLALTRPKTSRSERVIPLPASLVAVLRLHQASTPARRFVWSTDGHPWYPRKDWDAWKVALKRADLPDIPLHAARNTTATLLLEQGVDAHVIQQIMGHSEVVTTRGYQSVSLELARKGMAGLDGLLGITP